MDVRLSMEQEALRASVIKVVDDLAARAVGELEDRARANRLDAAVTSAGWRELRCASDDGKPWATGVEASIVATELGRRVADTSFVGPTLAAELRRLSGAAPGHHETVALAMDLSVLGDVVAIDSAGASRALTVDGGRVLSLAVGDFVQGPDLSRPVRTLDGDATEVGVITDDGLDRITALGLALGCGDLVGVMQGATELSVEYATQRRQYGVQIGSFQAVQHMLADAHVLTEGARSIAMHAAWAVDALSPSDAVAAAAVAKAYCARAARTVCETAIQVHGGIGNTWDCLAHVYLRRALHSTDLFGGVGPSLERVLAYRGIRG